MTERRFAGKLRELRRMAKGTGGRVRVVRLPGGSTDLLVEWPSGAGFRGYHVVGSTPDHTAAQALLSLRWHGMI